jgi:hypothetical protein
MSYMCVVGSLFLSYHVCGYGSARPLLISRMLSFMLNSLLWSDSEGRNDTSKPIYTHVSVLLM